jgi:hypothetical protein
MTKLNKYVCLPILLAMAMTMMSNVDASAQDDGARAYWNGRARTHVVSFQYLPVGINASGSQAFAPGQFVYPNSEVKADIIIGTWAYHMTLLNRPSAIAVNVLGGSVGADVHLNADPGSQPPVFAPSEAFSQSSAGFADPNTQLVVNLFGTPPLKSTVDLLNYEPGWSLDAAALLAVPLGAYESDKLVNMGLNRWYGRVALPFKYHFGVFTPGYMSSFELIPAVWLFAENDDFLGSTLGNDPLWSLEAHLTHDFNHSFFGSLDMLYQKGFQSTLDGNDVGAELEIGNLGFAFNYQVTPNVTTRASFSSNVFGDNNLETSVIRLQFVYTWNRTEENAKKLRGGH